MNQATQKNVKKQTVRHKEVVMSINPTTIVGQMRLNTGDFIEDEPYLTDTIYLYFYEKNGNSIVDGSIEALESIINYIALTPQSWTLGESKETQASVSSLNKRLESLKLKRKSSVTPIIVKSDRKDWNDFERAFGTR